MTALDLHPSDAQAGDLLWMDPGSLIDGPNHRTSLDLDAEFLASVADYGITQPCAGTITADGGVRLRMGFRRRAAAAKAGREVPVFILAREDGETEETIGQVVARWEENERRTGLSEVDRARAIQEALDLDLTEAQAAKALRVGRAEVRAAAKVTRSERAQAAAVKHGLTLIDAAGIADLEDYPDAVKAIEATLEDDPAEVPFIIEAQRQEVAYYKARDKLAAKLAKAGVAVPEGNPQPGYDQHLHALKDAGGNPLDQAEEGQDPAHQLPEDKGGCPGRAAWIRPDYRDSAKAIAMPYCLDPKAHGHKPRYSGSVSSRPDLSTEEAKAERARVITGNKAWRAARKLRRDWLREWLTRSSVTPDVVTYCVTMIAAGDNYLRRSMEGSSRQATAKDLLSIKGDEPDYTGLQAGEVPLMEAAVARATHKRAQVILAGICLAAVEDSLHDDCWRGPQQNKEAAAHLAWVITLGWTPSECEREFIETALGKQDG